MIRKILFINNIDILTIFRKRDKAIVTRNRSLFLSTQAGELTNCSFDGYVSVDKLQTDILSIYADKEATSHAVVFAKETYFPKEKDPYSSFVIYYLIEAKDGWKIYRLVY